MARVFKRPGDDFWWLDFTAEGKRHRLKTTTKSRRAAEDLLAEKRADLTRVKLGLELPVTSEFATLRDAWKHWVDNWCPEASKRREQSRFNAHVEGSWIGAEKLTELSGERIEKWLNEKLKAGGSPRTVNLHRAIMRCVFNALIKRRKFRGVNPVKETTKAEESEYDYQLLNEDEFKRVLPHLPADWRPMAVIAFTTGLRRGEIFALRKDRNIVDLEKRVLTIRASNNRNTPKGKKVKSVPLFDEALAVLQPAWDAAQYGELLFPSQSGGLRSEFSRAAENLRSAMARAGVIEGWNHTCRRPGCQGELTQQPDEQQRKCPSCGWVLWPKPIVRNVRFHDLRHGCAVYLLDRGVPLEVVSQQLRHSSIVITQKIYAHRTVETLRTALSREQSVERELERLAKAHPEMAGKLLELAKEAALKRHQGTNIVSMNHGKRGQNV
jgi:integrase